MSFFTDCSFEEFLNKSPTNENNIFDLNDFTIFDQTIDIRHKNNKHKTDYSSLSFDPTIVNIDYNNEIIDLGIPKIKKKKKLLKKRGIIAWI